MKSLKVFICRVGGRNLQCREKYKPTELEKIMKVIADTELKRVCRKGNAKSENEHP